MRIFSTTALIDFRLGDFASESNDRSRLLSISYPELTLILVRNNGKLEQIDTIDLGFPLGLELDIAAFVA